MPPLPSSETMRYRPASSVPGTNRLSECEGDEELPRREEPLAGVLGGDRGRAGFAAATVRVAKTSSARFSPQAEQKRLFSGVSLAQDGHFLMASVSHDRTRRL